MGGSQNVKYAPLPTTEDIELYETSKKEHDILEDLDACSQHPEVASESAYSDAPYTDHSVTSHNLRYRISRTLFHTSSQTSQYLRNFITTVRSINSISLIPKIVIALLPSYLHPKDPSKPPKKLYATSWLDGLRGVASVMVVLGHSRHMWYPSLEEGYGSCETCWSIFQSPFVPLGGTGNVAVFFVISGFSISYKGLGQMRKGNGEGTLNALSSSVFRRGMRLLLPSVFLTFFMMLATYYGFYATGGVSENRSPPRYSTFQENLVFWLWSVVWITDVFRPVFTMGTRYAVYVPPYDYNLWTIDVELYCSMVIFLTLIGISRLKPNWRLAVLIALAAWMLWLPQSYLFLFTSGCILAELHHRQTDAISHDNILPSVVSLSPINQRKTFFNTKLKPALQATFWLASFILAMLVINMPSVSHGAASSLGYVTLTSLIPSRYRYPYVEDLFWIYLAAVYLVFTISQAPFLQILFTNKFSQYLGKIGFALYLVHGTLLNTLGLNLSNRFQVWNGNSTDGQYALSVGFAVLCIYPLLFWVADLVWRFVDVGSVGFAAWIYGKVSVSG